ESVARVRQRPPDDHAHRVIEVRAAHLLFEAGRQGFLGELGHLAGCGEGLRGCRTAKQQILCAASCGRIATSFVQEATRAVKSRLRGDPMAQSFGWPAFAVAAVCQRFPISFRTSSQKLLPFPERRIMKKLNNV